MAVDKVNYEELLAEYSSGAGAIALLKQYRPYLEFLPSMRRPGESVITIPLPIVKLRGKLGSSSTDSIISETVCLPCDTVILMCDPEWKIKTGVEIFVFIHRPDEDFSDLLGRWRKTQVWLSRGYEWVMPPRHQHVLSEGAEQLYPLFIVFEETPERIRRGLKGAFLPFVVRSLRSSISPEELEPTGEVLVLDESYEDL
jgi:hypothetical protein